MTQPVTLESQYNGLLESYHIPTRTLSRERQQELREELLRSAKREGPESVRWVQSMFRDTGEESSDSQGSDLNAYIRELEGEIRQGMVLMGKELQIPILAGTFPTGVFNAECRPARGGLIILINTGTFDLLWEVCKLFVMSSGVVTFNVHDSYLPASYRRSTLSEYDDQQTSESLAEIIRSYLQYTNVRQTTRIPLAGGLRTIFTILLAKNCERFVLAHEVAHAVLRHVNPSRLLARQTRVGELLVAMKDWWGEFAADLFAAELLLHIVTLDTVPQIGDNMVLRRLSFGAASIAPIFFLEIDRLIGKAEQTVFDSHHPLIGDHPPSGLRIVRLKHMLGKLRLGHSPKAYVKHFQNWFAEFGTRAIPLIRERMREGMA